MADMLTRTMSRLPISLVFTLSVVAIFVVVVAVIALLDIRRQRAMSWYKFEEGGLVLANGLDGIVANFADVDALRDIAARVVKSDPYVADFHIFSEDGMPLAGQERREYPVSVADEFTLSAARDIQTKFRFEGDRLEIAHPVAIDSQVLGIVKIGFDDDPLRAELHPTLLQNIWQGLAVTAVMVLLAYVIARHISKPLRALARVAEEIGSGNLGVKVPRYGSRETAMLGTALEEMRVRLEELYLHQEDQIERRTQELTGEITQRNLASQALSEAEERVQSVFESAATGMVIVNPEGRFEQSNLALQDMLGYTPDELRGMTIRNVTHPEDLEDNLRLFKELVDGKRSNYIYEKRDLRKDGSVAWVQVSVSVLGGQAGKFQALATVQDITERKQLEEQLLQSQKMEAIGQLAGGVAHDFNNLLTPIVGYAQMVIAEMTPGDKHRAYMMEIQRAAQSASDLTRRLLTFSRQTGGQTEVLDLNDQILMTENMLRRVIRENIELAMLPAAGPALVRADPSELEQVLINLVINASDSMPNGGKIVIETANANCPQEVLVERPGEYVLLSVTDTGIGVSEEVKAHIFEPFFTTKEPGHGTGLGLSTCHRIVSEIGGYITFDSKVGQGTTFKVYLPRIEGVSAAAPASDESEDVPVGRETVLLVEDEGLVRKFTATVLREHGYTVLEATNGEEALRIAEQHNDDRIHLLLTDLVMPLMGGRELASRMRGVHPETKVLYVSGYTDDAISQIEELEPGVGFMPKPFEPTALRRKVRGILHS